MAQAEYGHQGVRDVVYVVLPGHTNDAGVRGTSLRGESERFLHRECREMDIIFRDELRVQDIRCDGKGENQESDLQITAIVCLHLVWSEGIVENFTLHIAIRFPLVGKHLEEGSASRSRTTKDDCTGVKFPSNPKRWG